MEVELKRTYSEVYSLLQILGKNFINKLPKHLYALIDEERLKEYNPQYSLDIPLENQAIKKEALSMIALFHLTFWCDSFEEQEELKSLFNRVKEEKQNKLYKNADQMFEKKKNSEKTKEEYNKNTALQIKKESIFVKLFNIIKSFFQRNN